MPYITEELWARTAEHGEPRASLLIEAEWPQLSALPGNEDACTEMHWVVDLVSGVRSIRAEMNVPPGAQIPLVLIGASKETVARLARHEHLVKTMARLRSAETTWAPFVKGLAQFVLGEATVALPLAGVIDFAKERARLEKELKKAQDEIARFDAKLANEQFVSRAPEEVLTEQREKRAEAVALAARLKEAMGRLGG
jgi:valyl-tRNA synthetase